MHEINLLDETFVKNQSNHYHMSIQTGLNGLCFSILDLQTAKYVGLRNYCFDNANSLAELAIYFSDVYQKDELIKLNYKSISHIYIGGGSTLVPAKFFDAAGVENYFKLNFTSSADSAEVLYNSIDKGNIFNIFSYPTALLNFLKAHLPQCKLFHHSSPFLENIIAESVHLVKPRCYCYVYKGVLNIAVMQNREVLFYNTFTINGISDIVFYLLSVFGQFNMEPKHTDLFISSDIDEHDEIFENLNNYFNAIRFTIPSKQFTYSYLFDELHLTRYSNLFNLALCE